jgi:hypothetical protein
MSVAEFEVQGSIRLPINACGDGVTAIHDEFGDRRVEEQMKVV